MEGQARIVGRERALRATLRGMTVDARTCSGCGVRLPVEEEDTSTLISAKYGWRLVREKRPNGDLVPVWRCPTCWREHKRRQGTGS